MRLTSVLLPLLLSLSVSANPVADPNAEAIAEANAKEDASIEARAKSVKCKFKKYGWKNVKCFYQGNGWDHSWFEIVGSNTSLNAKTLIMTSCKLSSIPDCPY